ncbi:MAG TPA: cation:proton antiporter [Acidimicrobiia bacterium]|nr:cation:proton antiporter [Acidimicrobiia bacterium]
MPEIAELAQTVEFRLLVLAFLILTGPILAERVKVPGLVGLIFLGMLFGPFVFSWVVPGGLISVVGGVGLLYLMFLAGIELDINTFIANRRSSVTFGLLTFLIPFGLSFFVAVQFLDYVGAAAALVGAMWASHTLVAYPEVKTAGLESNRAVGAAVSATVITDVLALVILGFAASVDVDEATPTAGTEDLAIMPVWLGLLVLAFFTLWLLPRMTQWFFTHLGRSRTQRFVWIFGGMAAGAFVSLLGGIEGLVGAFLAGIGMNRLVPANGQLMERIEFFGNALFVPAFLITVGLSIDPRALAEPSTLVLAAVFVGLVLVGKILAAVVSGLIFKLSWPEIGMMASLTIGQAAATLAIAQVGVSTGIFAQDILNAAVITVVVTVVITSFATRFFARRLEPPAEDGDAIGKHVLLKVSDRGDLAGVLDIGVALTRPDDGLLTPYVVCPDGGCGGLKSILDEVVQGAVDRGQDSEGITRVADTPIQGTLNLTSEQNGSMLLLPWDGPRFPGNVFFGGDIDAIGDRSTVPAVAARVLDDDWKRVVVVQGSARGLTVRREDSSLAVEVARRIAAHKDLRLVVYATDPDLIEGLPEDATIETYSGSSRRPLSEIEPGDLVVVPAHVAEDALGLGALALIRRFQAVSLVIVGGPGRLHVSGSSRTDSLFGGGPLDRHNRGALENTWVDAV